MASFESKVSIACPATAAWDFLIRPVNVLKISPPEMGLSLVDPPEVLVPGCELLVRVQAYGQTQDLLHRFDDFSPHQRFLEEQVKGPMRRFVHEHVFEAVGDGEVTVIDRIEFDPPGGMLGFLLTESRIKSSLVGLFEHRGSALKALLEAATA